MILFDLDYGELIRPLAFNEFSERSARAASH
jgi:hypothetical protein